MIGALTLTHKVLGLIFVSLAVLKLLSPVGLTMLPLGIGVVEGVLGAALLWKRCARAATWLAAAFSACLVLASFLELAEGRSTVHCCCLGPLSAEAVTRTGVACVLAAMSVAALRMQQVSGPAQHAR